MLQSTGSHIYFPPLVLQYSSLSLSISFALLEHHERAPNPSRFSKEGLVVPGTEVLLENVPRQIMR
jgi:hypothetical protein